MARRGKGILLPHKSCGTQLVLSIILKLSASISSYPFTFIFMINVTSSCLFLKFAPFHGTTTFISGKTGTVKI